MSEENNEFEDFLNDIFKKLEDKKTKVKFNNYVKKIQDLFEYPVEVTISYSIEMKEMDEYLDKLENEDYEEDEIDEMIEKSLTVETFIEHLKHEKQDAKILIDPINLKSGLNEMVDIITIDYDDHIIIVPKKN